MRRPPLLPTLFIALVLGAAPAAAEIAGPDGALTHRDTRAALDDVHVAATVATAQAGADGRDGLPLRWCGTERTPGGAPATATTALDAQIQVVYAHAADRPDRFAGFQDAMQADVSLVQRFLSAQSGGGKALRFAMGTDCGPEYVDVRVVHLPRSRAAYADDFQAIKADVRQALPPAVGPRDVMVMGDGLAGGTTEYGLGETVPGSGGERPGAANPHNSGGFTSILFSRDGAAAPGADPGGWWPEGFLHEITHNLGAVQWSAPHSTQPPGMALPQYGHCWQGADVMCYVEDAGAAHAYREDCPRVYGAIQQTYDCGRDDYFNPAPAAGSYLATHWNVYDAAFMAPCSELGPACGGGTMPVPTPPVSAAAPSVAGAPHRGATLTALPGAWGNTPTRYAFRWQRLRAGAWKDVAGATAPVYVPGTADLGRSLRVQVVATNLDGSAVAASQPTAAVSGGSLGGAGSRSHAAKKARKGKRGKRHAAKPAKGRHGKRAKAKHRPAKRTGRPSGRAKPGTAFSSEA